MVSKFRNKSGLTAYALACGYIQRAEFQTGAHDSGIDLYADSGCYHVRGYGFKERGRLMWESFPLSDLTGARKAWASQVAKEYGKHIAAAKRDRRYTVSREFHGDIDPAYIARFCDEYLGHTDTESGAWLIAARNKYYVDSINSK